MHQLVTGSRPLQIVAGVVLACALPAALGSACATGCGDRWERVSHPHFDLFVPAARDGKVPTREVAIEGQVLALDGVARLTWALNDGPDRSDFEYIDQATGHFAVVAGPLEPGDNTVHFFVKDRSGRSESAALPLRFEDLPPRVVIDEPEEDAVLSAESGVIVRGSAVDDFGVVTLALRVGDAPPIALIEAGAGPAEGWSRFGRATGPLPEGPVVITVEATDAAGQRGVATVTVQASARP